MLRPQEPYCLGVEKNCDQTYRFRDFDRLDSNGNKRPLQLEQALAALDVNKKSSACRYDEDKPIEDSMYITRHLAGKDSYTNSGDMFAFAVMLKGEKVLDGIKILPCTAIILAENETLDTAEAEWIIVNPKRPS